MTSSTRFTILAVDDSTIQNYALSRALEIEGFTVKKAYSGTEALQLASEKPDLIVLDVNLPDLNGFEVCRRLKADPDTANIPVVFLSATCQDAGAQAMAESVGARTFLFSPVEHDHLIAVIRGQLAKAAGK